MKITVTWILGLAVRMLFPIDQAHAGRGQGKGSRDGVCASARSTLSEGEVAQLRYMYEEEKLAHDVYVLLSGQWNVPPFAKIAASEARHQAAVKRQMDLHGVDSASLATIPAGQYSSQELQGLFDAIMLQGMVSIGEALKVGAAIETRDISDLEAAIAATSAPELRKMYNNLLAASNQHLAAFTRQLSLNGVACPTAQIGAKKGRTSRAQGQGKGRAGQDRRARKRNCAAS